MAHSCIFSPCSVDLELYKRCNLIERTFNKLKRLRRIASRYDRRVLYFRSFLHLAAFDLVGETPTNMPLLRSSSSFCREVNLGFFYSYRDTLDVLTASLFYTL